MAGIAHMGVGLAAKPLAPKIPLAVLIVGAYAIDIIWGIFYFTGVEQLPAPGQESASYWSHSLFMALIWSLLAALLARVVSGSVRTSLIIGLLVFTHWLLDFISHPMTAVIPDAVGLPLFFDGSPTVGLGLWRTQLGLVIGEYGTLILGALIYILTLRKLRKVKNMPLARQKGVDHV